MLAKEKKGIGTIFAIVSSGSAVGKSIESKKKNGRIFTSETISKKGKEK